MRTALLFQTALLTTAASATSLAQEPVVDVAKRVDAYFEPLVEAGIFSGTVLVARDGKVLVEHAYGQADLEAKVPVTVETRFKLMSVSKSLTAVAAMRLVQDGVLDLEDKVGKWLPDWPDAWDAVTVHDLLDHTSGIPNQEGIWSRAAHSGQERGLALWKKVASDFASVPLDAESGARFRYSNLNFELAGAVIEAASKKDYRKLLTQTVLGPAGMTRTGFDDGSRRESLAIGYFRTDGKPSISQQDMSGIQAAGGTFSTVADLFKLDRALRDDTLLNAATRQRMFTPKVGWYACGWKNQPLHGRPCIQHSGGANGYVADFLRFPADDACVVVMSNFAFAPITRLSHDVAGILFDADVPQPRVASPQEVENAAGIYSQPGSAGSLVVLASGGQLFLIHVPPMATSSCAGRLLLPVGDDAFAQAMGGGTLRFTEEGMTLETPSGAMRHVRAEAPTESWSGIAGDYYSEPRAGERVTFTAVDGEVTLAIEGGWPSAAKLLPVTESQAILLYADTAGTFLQKEGDVLTLHRYDGKKFRLAKR